MNTRSWRTPILMVLAAVATPILATVYLTLVGYRLGEFQRLIEGGTIHNPTYLYLFLFALLGAGVIIGARYRLWTAIGVAILGLFVLPWFGFLGQPPTDGGTVIDFMSGTAILTIGFFIISSGQVAVRNQWALRRWITPRSLHLGLLVGVMQFLFVVLIRNVVWGAPLWTGTFFGVLLWLWIGTGLLLLGAVPTILLVRFGLVTPVVIVGGLLMIATFYTLSGPGSAQSAAAGSPLTYYTIAWFIPLIVAILAAVLEYLIRTRWNVFPPRIEPQVS